MKGFIWSVLMTILLLVIGGCSTGGGIAPVGSYQPPPANLARARVGIITFKVERDPSRAIASAALGDVAADEMANLLSKTGRLDIIGRAATVQLLDQQGFSDAVKPGVLVHPAPIKGIDYLLVGSLSNLSIARAASGDALTKMENFFKRAAENKDVELSVNCGVGFSLVDPATGDLVLSSDSEFARTAPASALGIDVMAADAQATTMPISEEDREQVVKLALDDAVRKSLPRIDRLLASRPAPAPGPLAGPLPARAPAQPSTMPANAAATAPATVPGAGAAGGAGAGAAAYKICPNCGAKNDPAATFCKQCGAKL